MPTLKRDHEFVASLAAEFFAKPHVRQVLNAIDEFSVTGWEKWLQIEFAAFLGAHEGLRGWWRESAYELDQRLLASRKTCAVDFLICEKKKQSCLALEIKKSRSPGACVQGMLKDKTKIAAIKKAKFDIRSVWCLGVHDWVAEAEVRRLTNYYADKLHTAIKPALMTPSIRIGRTKFAYTLF